ncbi:hypothetical protein HMSSN036_04640 [Paenibacillus macerans]|nr:hypothetical protein HMSSN036_04640 [Paenibacillus macerans]
MLQRFELPTAMPRHLDEEKLIEAMMHDKKFKEQQLVFILPVAIGQVEIASDVALGEVRRVIAELKEEEPHV